MGLSMSKGILHIYRDRLGRIDNVDSSLTRHAYQHRVSKWTLALLRAYISMAIHNAWKTARHCLDPSLTLRDIYENLIHFLADDICLRERAPKSTVPRISEKRAKHFLVPIGNKKNCAYCLSLDPPVRSHTTLQCQECSLPCHTRCFPMLHGIVDHQQLGESDCNRK